MPSYCVRADLELNSDVTSDLDPAVLDDAIAKASALADSYLASKYTLPLIAPFDPSLVQQVAAIATYRVMKRRGYAPMSADNDPIRDGYKEAVKWLQDISSGKAEIQATDSNTDAEAREGRGRPSTTMVLQPPDTGPGTYSADEDFWHDAPSIGYQGGAFPRKRGF